MVVINDIEMIYDSIQIDITSDCNLSCKFCTSAVKKNRGSRLSIDDIDLILKKSKDIGVTHIVVSGGEPFTHPDIYTILGMIKEYGFKTSITTNGTLIDTSKLTLLEKMADTIQISIDSTVPEIHDSIRGVKGTFNKAIDALNSLKHLNTNVTLRAAFLPDTLGSEEEMVKFAIDNGATSISLNPVIASETTEMKNILTTEQMRYFFNELSNLYIKYKDRIRVSSANPMKAVLEPWEVKDKNLLLNDCFISGCTAGISSLYVNSNKQLWPCSHLPITICSIYDDWEKEFESSEVMYNLFTRNLKGNCGKCEYKRACGGCRGCAYGFTRDYLGGIKNCFYNIYTDNIQQVRSV